MQTKAYFASSVPAALEIARQELGENALLLSSKPAPPQTRQFGRLEVTFAWDPNDAPQHRLETVETRKSAGEPVAAPDQPSPEMLEIRQQLAALRAAVGRGGLLPEAAIPEEDKFVLERLADAGFSMKMAADLAAAMARRPLDHELAFVAEVKSRIPVAPFVEVKHGEGRTLAFIGPPGRGKTTSLVKIAVSLGLARRVPVRIYCAGAHCVGGQEQLARFAAILGTPFQACESLASLNLIMAGEAWRGLALVDTPGISPADENELSDFARFFVSHPEIEKHLVLRADAGSADMLQVISRFAGMNPSRILYTGMDEVSRVGPVVECLIRAEIPATFLGTGQQIPEDLVELNPELLARAAWAGTGASCMVAPRSVVAPKKAARSAVA
jgi:flagellar biosynthesis protein FlhF